MTLVVRTATKDDEAAAQRVAYEAFATVRSVYRPAPKAAANLAAISAALARLVAEDGDGIVGTVCFRAVDSCLRVTALANGSLAAWLRTGEPLARSISPARGVRGCLLYSTDRLGIGGLALWPATRPRTRFRQISRK